MNETDLLKLKRQIEDAKAQTSELKGHQSALMNQLKTDWKCATIEEAEKLMAKYDKEIKTLTANIEKGMKELEEKYNG